MVVYEYPFNNSEAIEECVLALGFFDGVHIAHRDLIKRAKDISDKRGLKLGIFSFSSGGSIKGSAKRLYGDGEKAEFFDALGADFAIFADFGKIAGLSPEEFVKNTLCCELNCAVCVAGFNFRFGKGASAGEKDLRGFMSDMGREAVICEEITGVDGVTLSASLIREMIASGNIKSANSLLGAPYYIKGRVLHGRAVGRNIGFPTANIEIEPGRVLPLSGVYSTAIPIDGKIYLGVTNIGTCPTFEERAVHLETHIIDYNGNLYDKELKIFLLDFIRREMTFSSVEELKMQINIDKNRVINENGDIKWQELGLKLQ